ncbi:alpha/beta fold hydrolase [Sphingomonas sp. JC676]|uniref:alpha/beta fold hydrolase n=1 Tax=Sphingomonas sp. JC676 TaxID=2768065 RepID=UPI001657676A|nr:alpha/beta fold hydrolase [Sphingomonas sp. JC676]MBC9033736.1 alpha/beta fold hydrolase [Sphingomonas sp. JC676]
MRGLVCLGMLALTGQAHAQDRALDTVEISAASVRDDHFPQVAADYPDGIVARPHVEFANYLGFRPLQLDLYLHADRSRTKPRPLILWVHGGGWSRGDARGSGAFTDFPAVLAMVAARGYVVASVDYRLSGEARFPAQIQDVKAAIRYLRSKAGDYGIDPERVVLWGGSAGGHLAALAATTCGVADFDPPASTGRLGRSAAQGAKPLAVSDCVQGAALWYGVYDLAAHGKVGQRGSALGNVAPFLGCDVAACQDKAEAASPIHHIGAQTPSILLIHGTADDEVAYQQTEEMATALKAAGRPVDVLLIPEMGHGLIGRTAAATRAANLQALQRTLDFFAKITARR